MSKEIIEEGEFVAKKINNLTKEETNIIAYYYRKGKTVKCEIPTKISSYEDSQVSIDISTLPFKIKDKITIISEME